MNHVKRDPPTGYIPPLYLKDAIYDDHPCDCRSCDIAEARKAGFYNVAAFFLSGSTETPSLDAFFANNPRQAKLQDPIAMFKSAEWTAWMDHHRKYGIKCHSCGGYTYGDDDFTPSECYNCLAWLEGEDNHV